ncbi:MAG: PhoU domain-containing protein [Sulfolobales archaeon]
MREVRRVQKFGKSTLMVSLPAEWVKSVGLRPGDPVSIDILEDNSVRVSPLSAGKQSKELSTSISVGRNASESLLGRVIYALYLLGVDRIEVLSEESVMPENLLRSLKNIAKTLIGVEITEYSPSRIVLQILIDSSKYSTATVINRMLELIRSMFEYIETYVASGAIHLLQEVQELEVEVDRLNALIVRQLVDLIKHKGLAKQLGVRDTLATEYRSIAKSLEEAADALSEIAVILQERGPALLEKMRKEISVLSECIDMAVLIIDRIIKTLNYGDLALANELLDLVAEYRRHFKKYADLMYKTFGLDEMYLSIKDMLERFAVVGKSLESIAESVFDINVWRSPESVRL